MLHVTKMKKFDDSRSNNSKTQRGKFRKHKPFFKLFNKNCCQKVANDGYTLSEKDVDSFKLQSKEEEKVGYNIEHLCYDENDTAFEEDQSVSLISSSSEIGESLEACKTVGKSEKGFASLEELNEEKSFKTDSQSKPIFVDLTADEKKPWKQMILDPCRKRETEHEDHSGSNVSEHRIMIADSSSKVNCNGNSSLATALRDRGPCTIPIQPNRSLPIRPVPSVPTRSYRKDSAPLFVLSKSANLNIIGVESAKSIDTPKDVHKKVDVNFVERMASKNIVASVNYVVPQISSVESLSGMKKGGSDRMEIEQNDVKESRKRERSQDADFIRNKEERVESSIKEYLANFCGSSATTEIQNSYTDKCVKIVSSNKEDNRNKVVPPLRLRKIVRTADAEGHSKSQAATEIEHESNYTIVTDVTPQSPGSPSSSNWKDMFYEKDTDLASLKTDSYMLKYRRNRLKQKLQELRSKALELAEKMANDASSQQNTRLRQVMNCYEKQIENLSKLHSKLSAALSTSKTVTDVNVANTSPPGNEYSFENLNESNAELADNNSSASSPEPPKLSPRSPLNYDDMLEQDVRNSPPILPKICVAISSSQESVDQEVQVAKKKVWPVNEESLKVTRLTDSFEANLTDVFSHSDQTSGNTRLEPRDNLNVDIQNSDVCVDKRSVNHSKEVAQVSEDNCAASKKIRETKKLPKEFPPYHFVQKSEESKSHGFSDHEPMISTAINSFNASEVAREKEMFQVPSSKQICSPTKRIGQFHSYNPALDDVSFLKIKGRSNNALKVTSNLGQSTQLNTTNAVVVNQETLTSQQNYKGDETTSDCVQKTTSSHPLTEQFPTLGNWLARMSNKQTSKSKSKLKTVGNTSFVSAGSTDRISGREVPKASGTNATTQGSTERWQYHSHQQQRQLLQHVASSVTLSQPATAVPSLRPGIYPPLSMAQFYPNNYAIDPYNNGAALTYHPAIYPYSTYPYHSRLHSSTLPGYHFPIQDSLRPVQHINKRFPSMQDPMIRYSTPSTSTLQHPSNLEFDRLRGNSVTNNIGTSSCLSSLFLTPPTLPSSHQALPRAPLLGYSAGTQFPRNRMVPDVVAAAAAAAVVAAASFDRQRETLTYNSADKDGLSTGGITNIIDGQSTHVAGPKKPVIAHRDASNRPQGSNLNEEGYENPKYQQMQNFLFDRLALVETTDNFSQANSIIGNDTSVPRTSMLSTTSYRVPLISSHGKLSKNVSGSESRSCETPHLGKMSRSPNSLHNFTCSNCGTAGPKFKCLGCEMAFYCHEQCQEEHWYVHVQKCPKKMPKLKKVT